MLRPCRGFEKYGMVRAWHGRSMASVNKTRPHCLNQIWKTHSKPLAARHGRGMGTACYVWVGLRSAKQVAKQVGWLNMLWSGLMKRTGGHSSPYHLMRSSQHICLQLKFRFCASVNRFVVYSDYADKEATLRRWARHTLHQHFLSSLQCPQVPIEQTERDSTTKIYIQGVTGGTGQNSGGYSLC